MKQDKAYRAGFSAAQAGGEYLAHRSGRKYVAPRDNTLYMAGWIDGLSAPPILPSTKISSPPREDQPVNQLNTIHPPMQPQLQIDHKEYHIYKNDGTYIGPVKEYSPRGAIAWASFLYDVPKDQIAAGDRIFTQAELRDMFKQREKALKAKQH